MNRLLKFYACACERKRRRLTEAQSICERLNTTVGDVVEASCRSVEMDDDRLHFWLSIEIAPTNNYANADAHLAVELRLLAAN